MTQFSIFWLDGTAQIVYGNDINEAINNINIKGKVVYYTDGDAIDDYDFDSTQSIWIPKDNVKYNLDFFPLVVINEGKDKYGNTIRSFFIDDTGKNKLMIKQNDKLITLILKLGTTKNRHIGTVTKSTRTIEINRVRGKHLFLKGNAYGFNHYVLKNQTSIDWIRLSDDTGEHWKIPVRYVLENGKFLHFKSIGYELQIFVSLSQIEQFKIQQSENRRF